jgi:phosphopantetheinyl transferase
MMGTSVFPSADFSVSHSTNAVVVAISQGARCGIDIERFDPNAFKQPVPEVFSRRELDFLSGLPKEEWRQMIELWTAKEAYAKLVGLGFFLDFSSFVVELDPLRLALSERGVEYPDGVHLESRRLELYDESYSVTIALRHIGNPPPIEFHLVDLFEAERRTHRSQ